MTREYPKNNSEKNLEAKIAPPTVGRIVLYFASLAEVTPVPAMVVAVVDGSLTIETLTVFNSDGSTGGTRRIKHKSDVDNSITPFWDWMDFQKGQAAKTEELEKIVKGKNITATELDERMGKLQSSVPSPEDGKR